MTQRDIAEAANVTEVTIRNRYKGLRLDQNIDCTSKNYHQKTPKGIF